MIKKFTTILAMILILSACSQDTNGRAEEGHEKIATNEAKPEENNKDKENVKTEESNKTVESNKTDGVTGQRKDNSLDDKSPVPLLEKMNEEDHFNSFSFRVYQKTESKPIDNPSQVDSTVEGDVTVKYDGKNMSEESKRTTTPVDGEASEEIFDSYFMKKDDGFEHILGYGLGDGYYKEVSQASPKEVNTNFTFMKEGKGLVLDEAESTDEVAVYKNTFTDGQIADYFYPGEDSFKFEELTGKLTAVMKIDLKTNTLIEYSYEADIKSTTVPSDKYIEDMYNMTDKKMDFEKYKQEMITVSTFKAENKMTGRNYDFQYNNVDEIKIPEKLENAPSFGK